MSWSEGGSMGGSRSREIGAVGWHSSQRSACIYNPLIVPVRLTGCSFTFYVYERMGGIKQDLLVRVYLMLVEAEMSACLWVGTIKPPRVRKGWPAHLKIRKKIRSMIIYTNYTHKSQIQIWFCKISRFHLKVLLIGFFFYNVVFKVIIRTVVLNLFTWRPLLFTCLFQLFVIYIRISLFFSQFLPIKYFSVWRN